MSKAAGPLTSPAGLNTSSCKGWHHNTGKHCNTLAPVPPDPTWADIIYEAPSPGSALAPPPGPYYSNLFQLPMPSL